MKIKYKISIIFSVFLIVVFVIIGFFIGRRLIDVTEEEVSDHLISVATSKAHHLDTFLDQQRSRIEMMASSSIFKSILLKDSDTLEEDKAFACERMQSLVKAQDDIYELYVVGIDGRVICANKKELLGIDMSDDMAFKNGRNGFFVGAIEYDKVLEEKVFFLSAPLTNTNISESGAIIAKIDTYAIDSILSERFGMSDTGEIYIINKDGYFISSINENDNVLWGKKDESINAEQCLRSFEGLDHGDFVEHGEVANSAFQSYRYLDYSGMDVLGVHHPLHKKRWCLIVQAEESDLFGSSFDLIYLFINMAVIFLGLAVLATFLISRKISRPIEKLKKDIKNIENNGLSGSIDTLQTSDEIGDLSESFSHMIMVLQETRYDIDKKVQEATVEAEEGVKNLADQRKAILNILEDIDEEKTKAKREKDKIDAILHSIGDAVFVVDKDFRIIMINEVATDMVGCDIESCIGKKYDDVLEFVHEDTGDRSGDFVTNAIEKGEVQEMKNHTVLISKKGKKIPVADSAAPLKDKGANVVGCVVVFRDVSREREIDKMKTDFVSVASHQLRTPLTAIRWFVEELHSEDLGKLNKEQKEYMDNVLESSKRMIRLVNDLLNVNRLETGRLSIEPKPTDMIGLIRNVIKEQLISTDIKIKFNKPKKALPKIKLDPELIRQVVANFISNAVKYTEAATSNKKKSLLVEVALEMKGSDMILSVKDSGVGIPKNMQSRLFEKFYRADNVKKLDTEGTGLGLYISKMIIEASGGKIWFESKENKGAKFFFSLPLEGSKERKGERGLAK